MIKKGQIITLSDDVQYLVLSKVVYQDNNYLYLTSMEDEPAVKVCLEKNNDLDIKILPITDEQLVKELIVLFDKDIQTLL